MPHVRHSIGRYESVAQPMYVKQKTLVTNQGNSILRSYLPLLHERIRESQVTHPVDVNRSPRTKHDTWDSLAADEARQ